MTESRHQRYRRENPEAYAASIARYRSSESYRQVVERNREKKRIRDRERSRRNRLLFKIEGLRLEGKNTLEVMQELDLSYEELRKITTG